MHGVFGVPEERAAAIGKATPFIEDNDLENAAKTLRHPLDYEALVGALLLYLFMS